MDLSIIIVSWNVKDKLRENLQALYESKGDLRFEVFVVDNNSEDGSAEMLEREFPQVRLLANEYNVGFARANNQAIEKTSGDYILLLNPDMRVYPDTLANMLKWMKENPQANVAGCRLVDGQGALVPQVRRWPGLLDQLAIVLKLHHLFPMLLNRYLRRDFDYSQPARVDSVRGGFFFVNAIKEDRVPLWLDEQFFLWFEEVDYCRRVKAQGGEIWYTPAARCVDYVGQSFKQVSRRQTQSYFRDSMLKYFRKWHPRWQYNILWLAWWPGMFLAWLGTRIGVVGKGRS